MATTNLPSKIIEDSAAGTRLFFDNYGEAPLEFNSTEVDAAISFFKKKGFDEDASLVVSTVLLKQAKLDNVPVFNILDSLSEFSGIQLSALVSEILNNNRTSTSTLGFKTAPGNTDQFRNIAA
jgi:hypothetical protein